MNYLDLRMWLMIALLGLGIFAGYQHQVIGRLNAEAEVAKVAQEMAQSANRASTAQIVALQAERDAFVLKRAMEQQEAEQIVAESREQTKQALAYAFAAKERIRQLSRQADCRTAMAMPICPAIADELRTAS